MQILCNFCYFLEGRMHILLTLLIASISEFDLLMRYICLFLYCIWSLIPVYEFGILIPSCVIFKDPAILSMVN